MVLAATNDRNSLHILVVEDEPILRADIATYLRDCGCAIYEAVLRAARPAIGVLYTSGNPLNRTRCVLGSGFLPKPYNKGEVLKACRDMHRGRISSESCMLGPIGFRSLGI